MSRLRMPSWVAAPGFGLAWSAVMEMGGLAAKTGVPAVGAWSDAMLARMADARVVVIDPRQVDALPQIPHRDLPAEMDALRLPFDITFVDMLGAAIPDHPDDGVVTVGALLANDADGISGFGIQRYRDGSLLAHPVTVRVTAGQITYDDPLRLAEDEYGDDMLTTPAQMVAQGIEVLRWLESVNVDLEEAPLTKSDRKRAARKDARIPLAVRVRQPTRRRAANDTASPIAYSHRFEVRGHYMHFTRGPIFDATPPDKLCLVPGIGICRRVWCPPHVKGPQHLPLVPKTRIMGTTDTQ